MRENGARRCAHGRKLFQKLEASGDRGSLDCYMPAKSAEVFFTATMYGMYDDAQPATTTAVSELQNAILKTNEKT